MTMRFMNWPIFLAHLILSIVVSAPALAQRFISTFAGTDWVFPGDGKPAVTAPLGRTSTLAVDKQGNLFIADPNNHLVFRIGTDNVLTVVAGNGVRGFSGDGGTATSASLRFPNGVAVDSAGNIFISDGGNNRIRKVTSSGLITTIAGTGAAGFSGDGGPASRAVLRDPFDLLLDGAGNLYVNDSGNNRV